MAFYYWSLRWLRHIPKSKNAYIENRLLFIKHKLGTKCFTWMGSFNPHTHQVGTIISIWCRRTLLSKELFISCSSSHSSSGLKLSVSAQQIAGARGRCYGTVQMPKVWGCQLGASLTEGSVGLRDLLRVWWLACLSGSSPWMMVGTWWILFITTSSCPGTRWVFSNVCEVNTWLEPFGLSVCNTLSFTQSLYVHLHQGEAWVLVDQ